jgi:hypothetical protein
MPDFKFESINFSARQWSFSNESIFPCPHPCQTTHKNLLRAVPFYEPDATFVKRKLIIVIKKLFLSGNKY